MIGRKYIVHVSGVGIAVVLTFYAYTCNPLPFSEITRIARHYVHPACEVLSYNIQPPELPQQYSPLPTNNITAVASSATVSTVSPSPSFEIPED
jgi:hypothetical protein